MRVDACVWAGSRDSRRRDRARLAAFLLLIAVAPASAFDGSTTSPPPKISPKSYASAEQALRAGLDDLSAGNAASCVDALTYAAEGGQTVARWKLGEMYADGVGVARDDVKAYQYFNRLVQDYDEDTLDPRNRGAVSSAFVAVGVYSLTGIPNSDVRRIPNGRANCSSMRRPPSGIRTPSTISRTCTWSGPAVWRRTSLLRCAG